MLADQIEVAQLILTTPDWLTSIEGRAGSAKTTTVGAIREFAEEHGYAVRGFAPTTPQSRRYPKPESNPEQWQVDRQ